MDNNHLFPPESQQILSSHISVEEIRELALQGHLGSDFIISPAERVEPREREAGGSPSPQKGGNALPCLFNNNSIGKTRESANSKEKQSFIYSTLQLLSPYHKKQAEVLHLNVKRVVDLAPSVGHIGFFTLTFKDNVTEHKEAYSRFRSMNTNFLSKSSFFGEWVCVKERQQRGAWHYHLIIQTSEDIRTGFDFKKYGKSCKMKIHQLPYLHPLNAPYRQEMKSALKTASPGLHKIWKILRTELPKYGFGRSELLPVLSNEDGLARYVGKYIGKHMGERKRSDKGVRLVNYSKNWVKNSPKFQWHTENSQKWRKNLKMSVNRYGGGSENEQEAMLKMRMMYGPNWLFNFAHQIINFDKVVEAENKQIPF